MKKIKMFRNIVVLALIISFFVIASSAIAEAASVQFTSKYSYGMRNSPAVVQLQQFLKDREFYSGPITGNYLGLTRAAVVSFQKASGLEATGTFGPLTRAAANALIGGVSSAKSLTLLNPISGTIEAGQKQVIKWTSQNYPASDVSVRLIRKVASNPAQYELVRTISDSTTNDGSATWVPATTDVGTDLVLEIGCKPSAVACQSATSFGTSLAVIRSDRYSNTASAFQAIEAADNR